MIKLSTEKGAVAVNPQLIRFITPSHQGGSKLHFDQDHFFLVNETPSEIQALISRWEDEHV